MRYLFLLLLLGCEPKIEKEIVLQEVFIDKSEDCNAVMAGEASVQLPYIAYHYGVTVLDDSVNDLYVRAVLYRKDQGVQCILGDTLIWQEPLDGHSHHAYDKIAGFGWWTWEVDEHVENLYFGFGLVCE